MNSPLAEIIRHAIQAADSLYHRVVLLAGPSGSGKTPVIREVADSLGTSITNINLCLSQQLLELTSRQRSLRLPNIMDQIVEQTQAPLILDNLEILFDTGMNLDPLRLLQGISRNQVVVASWSGTYSACRLQYAELGHPEYKLYENVDALIVSMDGTTSFD